MWFIALLWLNGTLTYSDLHNCCNVLTLCNVHWISPHWANQLKLNQMHRKVVLLSFPANHISCDKNNIWGRCGPIFVGDHCNSFVADNFRTSYLHFIPYKMWELHYSITLDTIELEIKAPNTSTLCHSIMKSISQQTKNDILSLLDQGKSCRKIALGIGVHHSTVNRLCSQHHSTIPKAQGAGHLG